MNQAKEQSQVQWGRTKIQYDIRRSDHRSTVALTVAPPGAVILTAPKNIPIERLDDVVHAKAQWITSRLRMVRSPEPKPSPREFVSGESFLYLGRQYRLDVRRGSRSRVVIEQGRFRVQLPPLTGHARAQAIRMALVDWYLRHAKARLTERVEWWTAKLQIGEPKVLILEQQRRWGSCAPGVVRFNWRIVQAPMRLLDYVVAHEITHLFHNDHRKEFWAALGRLLPDYEFRRSELRREGARYVW